MMHTEILKHTIFMLLASQAFVKKKKNKYIFLNLKCRKTNSAFFSIMIAHHSAWLSNRKLYALIRMNHCSIQDLSCVKTERNACKVNKETKRTEHDVSTCTAFRHHEDAWCAGNSYVCCNRSFCEPACLGQTVNLHNFWYSKMLLQNGHVK